MSEMSKTKVVEVFGQKVVLEERACAVKNCDRRFFTAQNSKQSICEHRCFEVTYGSVFHRIPMPPIRYPKEPHVFSMKGKGKTGMRRIIDVDWGSRASSEKHHPKISSTPKALPLNAKGS